MGFGTVILVALVPCCILLLEVVFEKVIGWICQQGPQASETNCEMGADSDHSSFSDSSEEDTIPYRTDLAKTQQPPDDGFWMPSPNGNNGRFVRPRNRSKSPRG